MKKLFLSAFVFLAFVVNVSAQSPVYANFPTNHFKRVGNNLQVNTNTIAVRTNDTLFGTYLYADSRLLRTNDASGIFIFDVNALDGDAVQLQHSGEEFDVTHFRLSDPGVNSRIHFALSIGNSYDANGDAGVTHSFTLNSSEILQLAAAGAKLPLLAGGGNRSIGVDNDGLIIPFAGGGSGPFTNLLDYGSLSVSNAATLSFIFATNGNLALGPNGSSILTGNIRLSGINGTITNTGTLESSIGVFTSGLIYARNGGLSNGLGGWWITDVFGNRTNLYALNQTNSGIFNAPTVIVNGDSIIGAVETVGANLSVGSLTFGNGVGATNNGTFGVTGNGVKSQIWSNNIASGTLTNTSHVTLSGSLSMLGSAPRIINGTGFEFDRSGVAMGAVVSSAEVGGEGSGFVIPSAGVFGSSSSSNPNQAPDVYWRRVAAGIYTLNSNLTTKGYAIFTNSITLPTNAAPANVTVGVTAPDAWYYITNYESGVRFKLAAWREH